MRRATHFKTVRTENIRDEVQEKRWKITKQEYYYVRRDVRVVYIKVCHHNKAFSLNFGFNVLTLMCPEKND